MNRKFSIEVIKMELFWYNNNNNKNNIRKHIKPHYIYIYVKYISTIYCVIMYV